MSDGPCGSRVGIQELARAAKVSVDTVVRFERGEELKERTVAALQRAFEFAGVEFTNGEQPGVRLTKAAAAHSRQTVGDGDCRKSRSRQNPESDGEETIGRRRA